MQSKRVAETLKRYIKDMSNRRERMISSRKERNGGVFSAYEIFQHIGT